MNQLDDKWVRRFTTDATAKHKNGFTIYKITSYIFPRASPEAVTALSVWKRYSELQRLQRSMKRLHQRLQLPGTCPAFTKWSYFKRLDPAVVADRRRASLCLLDFIAHHPPLFTSLDFVKFFHSSYPEPLSSEQSCGEGISNILAIRSSLLLPAETTGPLEYPSSEEDSLSTAESRSQVSTLDTWSMDSSIILKNSSILSSNSKQSQSKSLSGHPESTGMVENVAKILIVSPSGDSGGEAHADHSSNPNVDILTETSTLHQNQPIRLNLPDLISFNSNAKNLMDTSMCSLDSSNDSLLSFSDSASVVAARYIEINQKINAIDSNDYTDSAGAKSESMSETNLTVSSSQSVSSFFIDRNEFNSADKNSRGRKKKETATKTLGGKLSIGECEASLETDNSSLDLQESYVLEAGLLLSLGARSEAGGEHRKAFHCYKAAIEKMLTGVQDDTNDLRRQFVKDRTAKYLSYAEKIYTKYLNDPENKTESLVDAPVAREASALRLDYEHLRDYRVLGLLAPQVMLVLCSRTQACRAIKVIQKAPNYVADEDYFTHPPCEVSQPVLPLGVPYMVRLEAYIETPHRLFLVLQYASGGRLLDYVDAYSSPVGPAPRSPPTTIDEEVHHDKKPEESDEVDLSLSVTDMVIKSQRLLLNVDEALAGRVSYNKVKESLQQPVKPAECQQVHPQSRLDFSGEGDGNKFHVSRSRRSLPVQQLRRWAAELVIAVEHLHLQGVIIGELRGEDLLLGERGCVALSYRVGRMRGSWGSWGPVQGLGPGPPPAALPPELAPPLLSPEPAYSCDMWCLGVVLYELLSGIALEAVHPSGFNSHTVLVLPEGLPSDAESLLSQLLCFEASERLGSSPRGLEDVKSHDFFKLMDWNFLKEDYLQQGGK